MNDWLFENKRAHPTVYDVMVQGKKERTVSIRAGVSWPINRAKGYYILIGQLENKKNGRTRFIAFAEGEEALTNDLFKKITAACNQWRINSIRHGDETGEQSFSFQLWDYLKDKEKKYEIIQMPSIGKSWRCKQPDFLIQLVRNLISSRDLIFFNISEGRTPILIDKIKNTDMESDILAVPEFKALACVLDDFEVSPWRPPKPVKPRTGSCWGL